MSLVSVNGLQASSHSPECEVSVWSRFRCSQKQCSRETCKSFCFLKMMHKCQFYPYVFHSPPTKKKNKTAHCNTNIQCLLLPLTGNNSGYPASLLWNQLSLWRHSHTLSLLLRLSLKHFFLMKPHQHWYRKRRSQYWKQRHCQVFFRLFVLEPFNSSLCIICDFELQYCYIIKMTT